MITTLLTDITVEELCKGFVYDKNEGKGLFGWNGRLIIQPEYQRHYIYEAEQKEAPVIESVLRGYPLGLLYFVKRDDGLYEVLDGQQRITSLGRFLTRKFAIKDDKGMEQYFQGLDESLQRRILDTQMLVYVCEGTEDEIKDWFMTINIAGVRLTEQEKLNAIYSGPFVTLAKKQFSNSGLPVLNKWLSYVKADVRRQELLECALKWVAGGKENIKAYMSEHRRDTDIDELKNHFESVVEWVSSVFTDVEANMRSVDWGALYNRYHSRPYNPDEVHAKLMELLGDSCVNAGANVYEYILGGCTDTRLLHVRVFDERTKKRVYLRQTAEAKAHGVSNCSYCAMGTNSNRTKIWEQKDMDADHVAAWSRGGETTEANCEMLCKSHNRAKGNS